MKTDRGDKPKIKDNRTLNISNYRNLGAFATESSPEDRTFLKINRSLDRDELGGLVILLGLNNCGKSNVLDAVETAYNGRISDLDIPDFLFEKVTPKLEFNIANKHISSVDKRNGDHIIGLMDTEITDLFLIRIDPTNPNAKRHLNNYMMLIDSWVDADSKIIWNDDRMMVGANSVKTYPLIEWTKEFLDNPIMRRFGMLLGSRDEEGLKSFWKAVDQSDQGIEEEYGYHLSNEVHRYDDSPIRQSDLSCPGTSPNGFFTNLFERMEVNIEVVRRLFEEGHPGMKERFESEYCDKLMGTISDDFNKMLSSDPDNGYRFKLKIGESKLNFIIYRGNIPLNNLDRQSEGFRWVFDFYMNFVMRNTLSPGDIVLMDEFGYKLNPRTIKEVSAMMRSLGRRTGTTFIIATQNFMIVDTGHLDEVRLVVNENNGNTRILNEFDRFSGGHDVLEPLLSAMTIGRNYLRTENRRTVFVEGMSDYFFLTAFIHNMRDSGKDIDLDILPINGLGRTVSDMKETISALSRIERNPVVLVDGDEAGKRFVKECNRKDITVLDLSEIMGDDHVTVIEDMFTPEERTEFHLDNKEFDVNACFAQNHDRNIDSLSDETKRKFTKLIENIMMG